ncbi:MAG: carbonic anhydrase [Negativicutes bacterium]|nr:carbonic anhydrase [Negativicutes bacterium]
MERLLSGTVAFRQSDFLAHRELFRNLGRRQDPHTLFIACSDSRVDPVMLTKAFPGELFVVRNIANIVPRYRQSEEYLATTSAIEYAVEVLAVQNIVVCGHSNCGGCAALYAGEQQLVGTPHTRRWLEQASVVRQQVLAAMAGEKPDPAKREWLTEQFNVLQQVKNLFSYEFISRRYQQGRLNVYGWHYIIETGEVYNYNRDKGYFELINDWPAEGDR